MRLALAQINPVVGDLEGNRRLILDRIEEGKAHAADLVVLPELAVTGYPPEDLLLRPGFIRAAEESVELIAREARGTTVLVGAPHFDRDLYNACYVCAGGEVRAVYRKRFLPNYGVFDEDRYFASGRDLILLEHGKTLVGLTVCEDMWQPGPPATDLALAGAELLVNISASPFYVGRDREREEMFVTRARDNACFVAFCNAFGGQDELIFDGHSVVLDDEGTVIARAPGFEEAFLVADVEPKEVIGRRLRDVRRRALARERDEIPPVDVVHVGTRGPSPNGSKVTVTVAPFVDEIEQMRLALELGLRDYVTKNGFSDVVVGVSGGIDSAVTAAIAAEALGPDRVHCVSMPSRYSSEGTRTDASTARREPRVAVPRDSDRHDRRRLRQRPRRAVRRPGARSRRGEHPGARAWSSADGTVQQVRLDARRDRQQVRALRGLRDAVRRHGRRLRVAEGRLQDGRLQARAVSERTRGSRADPAVDHRTCAER